MPPTTIINYDHKLIVDATEAIVLRALTNICGQLRQQLEHAPAEARQQLTKAALEDSKITCNLTHRLANDLLHTALMPISATPAPTTTPEQTTIIT